MSAGRQIVLLRGINLGSRNRIAMPELRRQLTDAGYGDVRTLVQSGNIVLTSDADPDVLRQEMQALIASHFGLDIPVVVRTRDELAEVVACNPLGDVADNPKRYQVSFLDRPLPEAKIEQLRAVAAESERVEVREREVYAWHPAGVARSKLWNTLAGTRLGVTATARNWTTVTGLLEMADA